MADPRFYHKADALTVRMLQAALPLPFTVQGNADLRLNDIAALPHAKPDQISYCSDRKYKSMLNGTQAGAVCIPPELAAEMPPHAVALIYPQPTLLFIQMCNLFYPADRQPVWPGQNQSPIDPSASIAPDVMLGHGVVIGAKAEIGAGTVIGANSTIGPGVIIGQHCKIGPQVTISHAMIGDRTQIDAGSRIGQEGFGFAFDDIKKMHVRIPQLGTVQIEQDVQIGANVTIDRGALMDTHIGQNVIIDNLVQIGHNVVIGRGAIVVAQAGIAGSSKLGNFAIVAAQGGIADHVAIGDGAQIGAQAGIMRDVPAGARMMGSPALPVREFFRLQTFLRKLHKE